MTNKTEDRFYFGKSGQPERFARRDDLYRLLSRPVTISNKAEMARLASEAVKQPDFTPSGQDMSLHDLAHDVGIEIEALRSRASRPGQPERFAEIKDSDLYAVHDALNKRAIAANKNGDTALAAKYESWIERMQDMISLAREGQQERLRKYAQGLPIELRRMLPKILFSKSHSANQIERFDRYGYEKMDSDRLIRESWYLKDEAEYAMSLGRKDPELRQKLIALQKESARRGLTASVTVLAAFLRKPFSRPGQPERFDMDGACWEGYEPVGTKQKDGKTVPNCVPMKNAAGGEEQPDKMGTVEINSSATTADLIREAQRLRDVIKTSNRQFDKSLLRQIANELGKRGVLLPAGAEKMLSSRPGQPDTFDASSLERGAFAEASKSPMLGKLLAAKAMPDGGWRAVQVGSDTLVISFEDADLARDFGRRVASKGYSATSPVATTGRYWNVEVKNG